MTERTPIGQLAEAAEHMHQTWPNRNGQTGPKGANWEGWSYDMIDSSAVDHYLNQLRIILMARIVQLLVS